MVFLGIMLGGLPRFSVVPSMGSEDDLGLHHLGKRILLRVRAVGYNRRANAVELVMKICDKELVYLVMMLTLSNHRLSALHESILNPLHVVDV